MIWLIRAESEYQILQFEYPLNYMLEQTDKQIILSQLSL